MRTVLSALAILLATSCATSTSTTKTKTTKTTKTAATATTKAPRLFSLDVDGGQCHGRVRTLGETTTTQTLFSATSTSLTSPCPTSIVIDGPRDRVLAVHDDKVVSFSSDGTRTVLGALLSSATTSTYPPVLSVTSTGTVRVGQVIHEGVTVIEGTPQKIRFAGKDITIVDGMGLPPWGEPAVVVLSEHTATGMKQIEIAPTKIGAGDTPGIDALSTSTTAPPGVIVIADLLRAMTCVGGLHCDGEDKALTATIAAARHKSDGDVEAVGQLEHGGAVYAWATQWGDTPHAMAPLYRCTDKTCATKTVVDDRKDTRQLAIAVRGTFLLVAAEYENNNAILLDTAGTPLSIVPTLSTSVVFLP